MDIENDSLYIEGNDSLYIEELRAKGILLAREKNFIGCIAKIEFAIAQAKLLGLSERFINERLKLFLANRYSNIGDFDRAIEVVQELELFYNQNGEERRELYAKNNLGVYNQNIERHNVAYHHFYEGWQMAKEVGDLEDELDFLDGLSASCIKLGKLKEAETYLAEAEKLLKQYVGKYKEELYLYYYMNKSNHAIKTENDVNAEKYLLESVRLAEKIGSRKGADAYVSLARLSLKKRENEQALAYATKIIYLLGADEDSLVKDPYLLQANLLQAKALVALNKYEEALFTCKKAEGQAALFQRQYMFDESKLFLSELRRENLETGVLALFRLYEESNNVNYIYQALLYADQSKSNLLNERWTNRNLLSRDHRKDAVGLRNKLIFQLNELRSQEGSELSINLRNKLDSINNVLGVKNQAPFLVEDLKNFQTNLQKDEICLVYMHVDTFLFRFNILQDHISWDSQTFNNSSVVLDFYNTLKNPNATQEEFRAASRALPVLIPSQVKGNSHIKTIRIIPDEVLNYVVFDALPMDLENGNSDDIHYAAMEYFFSYDFSIQSSKYLNKAKTKTNFLSFAPDYSKLKQWTSLKNSEEMLTEADYYFEGASYFGAQAMKSNLQQVAPSADVLHLYTHGLSNDSSYDASYIVMQDEKIHVDEILALPLKAELSILTACEVGLGKEYRGEGITSIAWAFKAAGSNNVLQSMWKLNEQSSSQLMTSFFRNLANGNNSSKALTNAKRQYLNNSEVSSRLKHPYYWAGIGHYGSGAVIKAKAIYWWEITVGIALVVGLFLIVWLDTKKRH